MTSTRSTLDATPALSALDVAVLESIAYSDVFDFAVTAREVQRGMQLAASLDAVSDALDALVPLRLSKRGDYYALKGREVLFDVRERRRSASALLMRRALWWGRMIGRMPFVRMVAITGSLAAESAEANDDVDYLIVTAPGRVWLGRALSIVFVRLAALRGLVLCPNYVLSEDALALDEHDLYTARELAQMRLVAGQAVCARMLGANAWLRDFLPNTSAVSDSTPLMTSASRRFVEVLLGGRLGDAIERRIFEAKSVALRRAAPAGAETRFDETMAKGHVDAHKRRIAEALAVRLEALGIV